jgi:hypothetical protein
MEVKGIEPPIKLTATIYNIVESGIKHHNPYQKLIAMDYYNSGSNSLNQLFNSSSVFYQPYYTKQWTQSNV